MSFLGDYLHYNSGHEVPVPFTTWSAMSVLGTSVGRKVWYDWGYGRVYCNPYIALVGTAGSGKSTAKNFSRKLYRDLFPLNMISDSVQSWEDIAMKMASDACISTWKDRGDALQTIREYRPFYLIINEMRNFFSVAPEKMVNFLVDIFDEDSFSTGFKRQAIDNPNIKQSFENPYMSLLACVQPDWFMTNFKLDLFSGGLGRRLIIVYAEKTKLVSRPKKPDGADEAWERVKNHLRFINSEEVQGPFIMTPEADEWWDTWYTDPNRKHREDPILIQFDETEHIQLLKVAMWLALSEFPIKLVIEEAHLAMARHMLNELKPNIVRLTSGIGRNELAGVGAQVLDFLDRMEDKAATEVHLRKFFHRYMNTPEFAEVMNHYTQTHQLILVPWDQGDGLVRQVYMLPGGPMHRKLLEKQKNGGSGA